jgi:uncharacterized protein (TIGR02996 family)
MPEQARPNARARWEKRLRAIVDHPDDDGSRLSFASALEYEEETELRHPHERADFIRTQLKLARVHPGHPEWLALSARDQLLRNRYWDDWLPSGLRNNAIEEVHYFRGFVSHLTLRAFASVDFNADVLQDAPIEHVDIIGTDENFPLELTLNWLITTGLTERIVSLALDAQGLNDRHAEQLSSIKFPRLKWLSLTDNNLGVPGVAVLIERFQKLRFVDLDGNPADPHDVLEYDLGIVIDRDSGDVPLSVPDVSWLHRRVRGGRVVYPSRYRMVRPRDAGQFQDI